MLRTDARLVRSALCDLVLGDDARTAAAAEQLRAHDLWGTAVALSGPWRVTPIVHQRLGQMNAAAPDAAAGADLRRMTLAAAAHSALAVARSLDALTLLEDAGIEVVAIKGIGLLADLYGHRSVRMLGDLDVIVREHAFPSVRAALENAGYVDHNPALERHLSDIALSARLHNVARNFVRDGFEVDVHWRFGPATLPRFSVDQVIDRARRASLGARTIRVPRPVDAMLISAHHAMRGYFAPQEALKDAYDLAAWWRLRPAAWDLDELVRSAEEAELATALSALWTFVLRRDPAHPLAQGLDALAARMDAGARREAERLADFCGDQVARGTRAERTIQLFDGAGLRRSVTGRTRRLIAGAPPDHAAAPAPPRRPFARRVAGATRRMVRVLRELLDVPSYPTYRAVARAQGRHHREGV